MNYATKLANISLIYFKSIGKVSFLKLCFMQYVNILINIYIGISKQASMLIANLHSINFNILPY